MYEEMDNVFRVVTDGDSLIALVSGEEVSRLDLFEHGKASTADIATWLATSFITYDADEGDLGDLVIAANMRQAARLLNLDSSIYIEKSRARRSNRKEGMV